MPSSMVLRARASRLRASSRCPATACDCHIGYVHLEPLGLYDVFTGGVLERIPTTF